MTGTPGQWRRAIDVLLAFSEFGLLVTRRLETVAPDPELVRNSPFITLAVLAIDGPCRPTDLQERTGLTSGGMTKALQRLEDLGLVVRESGTDPDDGRAVRVSLTTRGHTVLEDLGRAFAEVPETAAFTRQARRVIEAIQTMGHAPEVP